MSFLGDRLRDKLEDLGWRRSSSASSDDSKAKLKLVIAGLVGTIAVVLILWQLVFTGGSGGSFNAQPTPMTTWVDNFRQQLGELDAKGDRRFKAIYFDAVKDNGKDVILVYGEFPSAQAEQAMKDLVQQKKPPAPVQYKTKIVPRK